MSDVTLVGGLGFGDEGKGATVARLTRELGANLVVRYNGGAQAGHNVVLPDGRHHCFSQWGSGTFSGARTLLSRFVLVNPIFALEEARHLVKVGIARPLELLVLEKEAVITTPFHVASNRLAELVRGNGRHGSCGMGIGETREDQLEGLEMVTVADLAAPSVLRGKLADIQKRKRAEILSTWHDGTWGQEERAMAKVELDVLHDAHVVEDTVRQYLNFAEWVQVVDRDWLGARHLTGSEHVLFEGAQGVLLDETHGFQPHTTWTDCTWGNAFQLLAEVDMGSYTPVDSLRKLGVLRVFHTRHGSGPFPTETWAPKHRALVADDHNAKGPWQGDFRIGAFDAVLARYALRHMHCDGIVFTHADKLEQLEHVATCLAYDVSGWSKDLSRAMPVYRITAVGSRKFAEAYVGELSEELGVPVASTSWGPTW